VELTIILVVLLTVVFGCIDLGRFATTDIALTNAAREAAWVGGMNPYNERTYERWKNSVRQAALDELQGIPHFAPADLKMIDPVRSGDDELGSVRVEVSYPFATLMPWPAVGRPIEMTRSAEMPVVR
jgi:hypothetical protein